MVSVATPSSYGSPPVDPRVLYPRLDWSRELYVLGIESTAHTFGVGVASTRPPYILSSARSVYRPEKGGIHPREAAAHHARVAPEVLRAALDAAGLRIGDIDAVAVALGPGLGPALRVGATVARGLAAYFRKPLVPVNHALAHVEIGRLYTGLVDPLVLYVSGGNTMVTAFAKGRYRVFGETLDVALGNLLDTFAREAGLAPPYVVEGLHVVDRCALEADEPADLPYTVKGMDVSYSGLLTAALRLWRRLGPRERPRVCLGLREVAYSEAVEVAERGAAHTGKPGVLLTGGVAASPVLRERVAAMAEARGLPWGVPPLHLCGDNGAMIAWVGLLNYMAGITVEPGEAVVKQRWRLDSVDVPWR
ncbi:MAG: N(6)-L-threonylcarbamoyladenine synthase Kae1 [Crenarchaeota archaeon]|nr:N(6)-L-threonylcarbamoyladenine synthase Kae1 [Thermoproteota archaeon]